MRAGRLSLVTLVFCGLLVPAFAGSVEDGRRLLKDGKPAEAAAAFRAALKSNAANREALLGLAQAVTEGRLPDDDFFTAEEGLQKLVGAKEDRELRLALGNLYLARSETEEKWKADVQDQFSRLLRADPLDEQAAVGLARMYWTSADPARGVKVLNELLEKKPAAGFALYWKGRILYDEGTQAFQAAQALTPEVQGKFEQALQALEASTKADGARYDAWIKLGYAAQYLAGADPAKKDVAAAAYRKALDVDGDDASAMKGLSALYANDPQAWTDALARLSKERPTTPIVLYYQAFSLRQQKKLDEAEKDYRAYVAASKHPAAGWFEIGSILEERGDAAGAKKAYEQSLRLDPKSPRAPNAAEALWNPIHARGQDAQSDPAKLKAWVKEAAALIPLTPGQWWMQNNIGFVCREAWKRTRDPSLHELSVKYYEEGVAIVGEWKPEYEATIPFPTRYANAQLINDTGIMYDSEATVQDLKKAESYYRRAQEWSQNGYWDAYTNLVKLLEGQKRWKEAYDYATDCAEGLKNPDGTPNETWRGTARGDAARFKGKIPE